MTNKSEADSDKKGMANKTPLVSRPQMPDGYGVPKNNKGLLPWQYVIDRMEQALNYWIGTVDTQGRPHAMPVWGAWVGDSFYFEGSPQTQRGRNIERNPAVVVHLENGSEVVVLHGEAEEIKGPDPQLAQDLAAAMAKKYKPMGYAPTADSWNAGGLYRVTIRKAFAWTQFPKDTTRWQF